MVPSCDHGQASAAADVERVRTEVIRKQQKNRNGRDDLSKAEGAKALAEGLRDGTDDVDRVGRNERQNRTGAQDIEQSDDGSGEEDRASQIAGRFTRLPREYGDVFKPGEGTERHFCKDTEAEKSERGRSYAEWMVCGQRTPSLMSEGHQNQRHEGDQGKKAPDIGDPLADSQSKSSYEHQRCEQHNRCNTQSPPVRGHPGSLWAGSIG